MFLQLQDLFIDQIKQFGIARFNHLSQRLSLQATRRPSAYARYFDVFGFTDDGTQCATVTNLDGFGVARRRPEGIGDIAGHHVARVRDYFGVTQRAAGIDGDIHCTTTNIHHADAQLTFVFC
ncbi:hypothetical protein SB00610_02517 [Klebsiella quasipneumoniae subsp. similipneumoniae]|nr:hypothetical protein SB00610_02517 [Klebsiella quasipneumoniae subsp. similipneumoniae]